LIYGCCKFLRTLLVNQSFDQRNLGWRLSTSARTVCCFLKFRRLALAIIWVSLIMICLGNWSHWNCMLGSYPVLSQLFHPLSLLGLQLLLLVKFCKLVELFRKLLGILLNLFVGHLLPSLFVLNLSLFEFHGNILFLINFWKSRVFILLLKLIVVLFLFILLCILLFLHFLSILPQLLLQFSLLLPFNVVVIFNLFL